LWKSDLIESSSIVNYAIIITNFLPDKYDSKLSESFFNKESTLPEHWMDAIALNRTFFGSASRFSVEIFRRQNLTLPHGTDRPGSSRAEIVVRVRIELWMLDDDASSSRIRPKKQ
jgi:hypothetical protein